MITDMRKCKKEKSGGRMILKIHFIDRVTFGQQLKTRECGKQVFGEVSSREKEQPVQIPQGERVSGIWEEYQECNGSRFGRGKSGSSCQKDNEKPEWLDFVHNLQDFGCYSG